MKKVHRTRTVAAILVLTLISLGNGSSVQSLDDLSTTTIALLELTLKSIDAGLEFMNREHQQVNLDAIIGTRIVEGCITRILYLGIICDCILLLLLGLLSVVLYIKLQ